MACPKCGSENVDYQFVQTGSVGAAQNTVVIQQGKRSKGLLYWVLIGWWLVPMYWIFIGWWWRLLFGGGRRGGINFHADKTLHKTMALCKDCGNSWTVK